jgi:hypothetical protein
MNDFVRDDEAEDYTKICTSLWSELTPEGTLEQNFTTEIVSATWRLRRCRITDEALGPMLNPATEKQQKSVDRARAQAHNALRRSIAELRALQTERTIRLHLDVQESIPGLTNTRQLLNALKVDNALNKDPKPASQEEKPKEDDPAAVLEALMAAADQQLCREVRDSVTKESMSRPYPNSDHSEDQQPLVGGSFCKPAPEGGAGGSACPGRDREAERTSAEPAAEDQQPLTKESMARPYPNSGPSEDRQPLVRASFCKPASQPPAPPKQTPRNAPCPCGSGRKYKRCHGNPVSPAQKQAA